MQIAVWTSEEPKVAPNGMGFDIDFELDGDGLRDFFNHIDPLDAVTHLGETSLLDEIGQTKAEQHFNLVPADDFKKMEERADVAEAALKEPVQRPSVDKNYIDYE